MAIVRLDALRTVAFGGISGAYAVLGIPLAHNWREVSIINNTDGDLFISVDGVTDNIFVPKMSFVLLDVSANADSNTGLSNLVFALFTQFYVKQSTAPTTGAVYLQGFYAQGE